MAGPGKPGPMSAEEAIQRKADMWEAKVREHLTQAQLAQRFGISQQRVSQLLAEAAAEKTQHTAEVARKFELDKLDIRDQECRRIIEQHMDSDNPMVLAAHASMDRNAKLRIALEGLAAPVKQEVTSYSYTVNGVKPDALK